MCYMINVR